MTLQRLALAVLLAAASAGPALARPSLSRDQVLADLQQARATGAFVVPGDLGGLARDRFPGRYPVPGSPLRADNAGAADAYGTGHAANRPQGDLDLTDGRPPAAILAYASGGPGASRADVHAELVQAARSGDLMEAGEAGRMLRDVFPGRFRAALEAARGQGYAASSPQEAGGRG